MGDGLTVFHQLEGWASRPTLQLKRWIQKMEGNLSDNGRPLKVPDVALFVVSVGVV